MGGERNDVSMFFAKLLPPPSPGETNNRMRSRPLTAQNMSPAKQALPLLPARSEAMCLGVAMTLRSCQRAAVNRVIRLTQSQRAVMSPVLLSTLERERERKRRRKREREKEREGEREREREREREGEREREFTWW